MVIPESWDGKRLLLFDQCQDFVLADLDLQGSRNPVTLNRCSRFCIERLGVRRARGYGLTLLRCDSGTVRESKFVGCLASGINIVGQCRELHVQHCRISGSTGLFNWDAGINCMHCSSAVTLKEVPDTSHEAIDLREKLDTPHRIWIEDCEISQCRAQGIYLEGAAQVLIEDCLISDNNKEGICFDWGTALSHLRHSQLVRNGERADYDESACAIDFLPSHHRDNNGRHWCQLPGISIDNGYANTIEHNLIAANYGGAVKIVRSGFNNLIRFNSLGGNSNKLSLGDDREAPANPYQPSEIKILNMGPGNQEEFDSEMAYLDFLSPEGNLIYGNLISGRQKNAHIHLHTWDPEKAFRDNRVDI
jgi:parallel beta-helix repeat protein